MSVLPKGWVETTLGEFCEFENGDRGKNYSGRSTFVATGIPFVSAGHLTNGLIDWESMNYIPRENYDRLGSGKVKSGDFLFCLRGSLGKYAFVPVIDQAAIASSLVIVRPDPNVESPFVDYYFRSPIVRGSIGIYSNGVAQPNLSSNNLARFALPLPPLAEQKRIVAKLDALNAKSARARTELARIETLVSRYKQAVLRSSFLGKLTTEWRSKQHGLEPASELIARTPAPSQPRGGREATERIIQGKAALAVNEPSRPAPSKWHWVLLSRVARQETGHTPSRSHPEWWGGDIPWIGIKDAGLHHGKAIDETLQKINEAGLANSSARLLPAGTVCLSRTASVGYVTIMGKSMATSQDFVTWTCSEALVPKFLMYALMAEGDDIREFGKGTTHTTIYFPEVRAMQICLAPLAEQHEIVRRIESSFARIDRLAAQAKRALELVGKLDEAILAKAFRGELVPQDENDEPAEKLLERIRAERAAAPKGKRGRGRKT